MQLEDVRGVGGAVAAMVTRVNKIDTEDGNKEVVVVKTLGRKSVGFLDVVHVREVVREMDEKMEDEVEIGEEEERREGLMKARNAFEENSVGEWLRFFGTVWRMELGVLKREE